MLARECLMQVSEQILTILPNIHIAEQTDMVGFLFELHKISRFGKYSVLLEQCQKDINWSMFFIHVIIQKVYDGKKLLNDNKKKIYEP